LGLFASRLPIRAVLSHPAKPSHRLASHRIAGALRAMPPRQISNSQHNLEIFLIFEVMSNTWHMGGLHLIMLQVFSFYLGEKIRTFALQK
jgi:hypothetical protein